ncbi:glutathione S-transferase family protein [Roseiarcaceae bacterium H3SJ34-1]|uniref:glutathione S-transferase family protein n=1 Tax=Terripilifer ovatus TaxID=3032367 RepID=UPI003AB93F14|nr:glutathione S-transferase family protein [Roseiarcaceae bacterium H3SJ34-1]
MPIEMYDLAASDDRVRFSPYCWRIRMAMAHKGLDFETIPVRFMEKHKIEFSGQKLVPVIRDNDKIIHDSWDIALYLDETYADRPKLIDGPQALALTDFVRSWAQTTLSTPILKTILTDLFNGLDDKDKPYFRTSREQRFGTTLENFALAPDAGRAAIKQTLTPLRDLLGRQKFICGATPAFADYIVFGVFMWAHCVSHVMLIEGEDPVQAWRERMLDLYDGLARKAPRNPA